MAQRGPLLLHKLEGHTSEILSALLIPHEEGIITAGADNTVRVWLKRDNNHFWPSICHSATSSCTALAYQHDQKRLFVGLANGVIVLFQLTEDLNRMERKMMIAAHQGRVTDVTFCALNEWVMSVSRDKSFQWHCSQTGRRLGTLHVEAWCTKLVYDHESQLTFVADFSGKIYVLKLETGGKLSEVSTLNAHSGSVQALAWDFERKRLISGGFDQTIIIWDIGGGKGQTFELNGHFTKITSLYYSHISRKLISTCEEKQIGIWDLSEDRMQTLKWEENSNCQLCGKPFIFNLKEMFSRKELGKRQHHCRKCGKAICDICSPHSSPLPDFGYERPVRVCNDCMRDITQQGNLKPQAAFVDIGVPLSNIDVDMHTGVMMGISGDRVARVWDVRVFIL